MRFKTTFRVGTFGKARRSRVMYSISSGSSIFFSVVPTCEFCPPDSLSDFSRSPFFKEIKKLLEVARRVFKKFLATGYKDRGNKEFM